MRAASRIALFLMVLGMFILHQDFWNWRESEPLVFGFLPIGLAYHAAYSIAASVMMAVLVKAAWPRHLENVQPAGEQAASSASKSASPR